MGRRRSSNKGIIFVALGLGLLISFVFPDKFIVVVLASALVVCGITLCKS